MSLFSIFSNSNFSYVNAIKKYGTDKLAGALAQIVQAKFSQDPFIRQGQLMQFLREEADAMSQAGDYPAKVAQILFDDESQYRGAMAEDAEYPIDYPGGPQQTLLKMTLDFMKDIHMEGDEPAKLRCEIVKNIAEVEMVDFALNIIPNQIDAKRVKELKRKFEAADELLGRLIKDHKKYFSTFMPKS